MKEKKWDVYIYGDCNIDLLLPGVRYVPPYGEEHTVETMKTCIGGGAALFALGVGKLGLKTAFQGKIGADFYGEMIKREMENNNVDTSLLAVEKEIDTGISISFTDETDRSFLTYPGTNGLLDVTEILSEEAKKARHIHMTGYQGKKHQTFQTLLEKMKQEDMTVSFDVGWDDTGEWYEGIVELMPYIDVLFMNETEAVHYGRTKNPKEAMKKFSKKGPMAVGKFGKKGSYAVATGKEYEKAGYKIEAKDTTGAGDSFNAGFIYGFLRGHSVEECLKYGNACGAMSAMELGGNTGFPDEEKLNLFI